MKKILCFGDSNTFGYNPENAQRFEENVRWAGILKRKLLPYGFSVIEAGGNNRKCFINVQKELLGAAILPQYLKEELDFVILGLGINDIQKLYKPNNIDIEKGIYNLINITKKYQKKAKILILSPSVLKDNILSHHYFSTLFDEWSIEKSKEIFAIYEKIAKENNCDIINLNDAAQVSEIDGLHYDSESHKKIAQRLFDYFIHQIH